MILETIITIGDYDGSCGFLPSRALGLEGIEMVKVARLFGRESE
jgi:hypothetical protein